MPDWLAIATAWPTVRRGLMYAFWVGALLIGINHYDAILSGDIDRVRLAKMGLTVIVPYMVSTFSSVGAALETRRERSRDADDSRRPDRTDV